MCTYRNDSYTWHFIFCLILVIDLHSTLSDAQVEPLFQSITYLNLFNPVCEIESETDPIVIASGCFPLSARSKGRGELSSVIDRAINNTEAILADYNRHTIHGASKLGFELVDRFRKVNMSLAKREVNETYGLIWLNLARYTFYIDHKLRLDELTLSGKRTPHGPRQVWPTFESNLLRLIVTDLQSLICHFRSYLGAEAFRMVLEQHSHSIAEMMIRGTGRFRKGDSELEMRDRNFNRILSTFKNDFLGFLSKFFA